MGQFLVTERVLLNTAFCCRSGTFCYDYRALGLYYIDTVRCSVLLTHREVITRTEGKYKRTFSLYYLAFGRIIGTPRVFNRTFRDNAKAFGHFGGTDGIHRTAFRHDSRGTCCREITSGTDGYLDRAGGDHFRT
jgi:hypothetical protein